jgi:hypothetical protein
MPFVRSRLSWIVGAWLVCQVAGLAAAPIALCCANQEAAADTPSCCRGLAPGQKCPMHHHEESDRTCKMRNACSQSDAALLTLSGGLGVLPSSTVGVSAFDPGDIVATASPVPVPRSDRPESPPPRA